jgi:hypothetical protein
MEMQYRDKISRQVVFNDGLGLGQVNRLDYVLNAMLDKSFSGASNKYFRKTSPGLRDLYESTGRKGKMQRMFQYAEIDFKKQ